MYLWPQFKNFTIAKKLSYSFSFTKYRSTRGNEIFFPLSIILITSPSSVKESKKWESALPIYRIESNTKIYEKEKVLEGLTVRNERNRYSCDSLFSFAFDKQAIKYEMHTRTDNLIRYSFHVGSMPVVSNAMRNYELIADFVLQKRRSRPTYYFQRSYIKKSWWTSK